MSTSTLDRYERLRAIAQSEFGQIISGTRLIGGTELNPRTLRLLLMEDSFLDIQSFSTGRYAFHWQTGVIAGRIYRWDNADHDPQISTHPHHFHNGHDENVVASELPHASPEAALRFVLTFVAAQIQPLASSRRSESHP